MKEGNWEEIIVVIGSAVVLSVVFAFFMVYLGNYVHWLIGALNGFFVIPRVRDFVRKKRNKNG